MEGARDIIGVVKDVIEKGYIWYTAAGVAVAGAGLAAFHYYAIPKFERRSQRSIDKELQIYGITPEGLHYERVGKLQLAQMRREVAEPELTTVFNQYYTDVQILGEEQTRRNFWSNPTVLSYIKPLPE